MWPRCAAALIDGAVSLLLAMLLANNLGVFFARRAVVTLLIDDPDSIWKGPAPLVLGALGNLVYVLPLAVLVVLLAEPLTGSSPGKALMRLVVVVDGAAPGPAPRWRRFLLKASGPLVLTLALLVGRWQLAALGAVLCLVTVAGLVIAVANGGRATWHDLLAGTEVRRAT